MKLRRATMDDAIDVLAWRNDPDSIAMSKTQKPVEEADHLQWFQHAVEDPDRLILVAIEDDRKIGMVRFDRSTDSWLVSINLAPQEREKRFGRPVLAAGIKFHRAAVGPARLAAEIKEDNVKSVRLFEGAGFERHALRDGFYYLIRD